MTSADIARLLLARIDSPRGSVSISAEPEPTTGFALHVWALPHARLDAIPDEFLGNPVIVESAPTISAQADCR